MSRRNWIAYATASSSFVPAVGMLFLPYCHDDGFSAWSLSCCAFFVLFFVSVPTAPIIAEGKHRWWVFAMAFVGGLFGIFANASTFTLL